METLFEQHNIKTISVNNRELCYVNDFDDELSTPSTAPHYWLNHFQCLIVEGNQATSFLQGQITINVETLSQSQLGAYCNIKGRIISLFYCQKQSSTCYYLFMPKDIIEKTKKKLSTYAKFSKVELTISKDFVFATTNEDGVSFKLIGNDSIKEFLTSHQDSLRGSLAFHSQQIAQHIPSLYPSTCDTFLPHKIGLDKLNAIDVKKGCYLGQEIIARMHFKGKLKTFVTLIKRDKNIMPGEGIIIRDKTIGEAIDSSPTREGYHLVLASVLVSQKHFLS